MLFTNLLNKVINPFFSGMLEIIRLIILPIILFIIFTVLSYVFLEIREKCIKLKTERTNKRKWGKAKDKNKKSEVDKSPSDETQDEGIIEVQPIDPSIKLIDDIPEEYEGHPENYFNKGDMM